MAQKRVLQLQRLCGTDLSHSASDVAPQRSPDCPNMMRSVPGKVRKRMGYYSVAQYDGRINGRYRLEMCIRDRSEAGRKRKAVLMTIW